MIAKSVKLLALAAVIAMASGCGDFVRQGRSPVTLVVTNLRAASGNDPSNFGGTLLSDVITNRTSPDPCSDTSPCPTILNDIGSAEFNLVLKDQGSLTVTASPSLTNAVTIDRYRVEYARTDGRNTQGVDVPYAFDSALTITVPADGSAEAGFQIVRVQAKAEAPLKGLSQSGDVIATIATVTFWGHDQAGNQVSAVSHIGIDFGDFADTKN